MTDMVKHFVGNTMADRSKAVTVVAMFEDKPLYQIPLKHVVRHSPTGFEWGYGGSGPADLALSILTNAFGREIAEAHYQSFKDEIVANFGPDWAISIEDIKKWLRERGVELK